MRASLFVLVAVWLACVPPVTAPSDSGVVAARPDFTLEDVNPNAATFGQQVGPKTFAGRVTGWYFGHSS